MAATKTVRVPLVARVSMEFLPIIEALAFIEDVHRSRLLAELIQTHPRSLQAQKDSKL